MSEQAPTVEWMRISPGYRCPFLLCLVDADHEHPVCPSCGAVRYGNIFCETCTELRGDPYDLNPHRLVPTAEDPDGVRSPGSW